MTINHKFFLNLAFQIAERNLGKTGQNPTVGSIVVKNDTVISSGVTSINGRPHAEFNALNKVKNTAGSTLYTTLEPCIHQGKTPPCVNVIIKKKIRNVFFVLEDPDLRTFKKAKKFDDRNLSNFKSNTGSEIVKYQPNSNFTFFKFLSYILVLIISFIGLIIVLDTFKSPLYNIFPNLELFLFSLYETLKDIELFINDLF